MNSFSVQNRLGPDVLHAKSNAAFEGEFASSFGICALLYLAAALGRIIWADSCSLERAHYYQSAEQ